MALPSEELVHEALVLAEQLSFDPNSHYCAALNGGPQFLGWDESRYIASHQYDLMLAILAGLGGKTLRPDDLYPRPQRDEEEAVKTIAEFDVAGFTRKLYTP